MKYLLAIIIMLVSGLTSLKQNLDLSLMPLSQKIPQLLVVASGSMSPTLERGDVVLVKPEMSYQLNDLVSYHLLDSPETLVTHRIVELHQQADSQTFTLKGDSNQAADAEQVTLSQINGKVTARVPKVGWLLLWLQTPLGAVGLIVIPVTIVVYEELKNLLASLTKLADL